MQLYIKFVGKASHHPDFPLWFNEAEIQPKTVKQIFGGRPDPAKKNNEKSPVQPWWSDEVLSRLKEKERCLYAFDGHDTPTLGTRKPDVPLYVYPKPRAEFYMVAVGDLKPCYEDREEFADAEKGHILELLFALLDAQPFCKKESGGSGTATGFLCNGHIIQFFRLDQVSTVVEFYESKVMHVIGEGRRAFLGLLDTDPALLGWTLPHVQIEGKAIKLNRLLGTDASAMVFQAKYKDADVVVKVFQPTEIERLPNEVAILQKLQCLQPRVPSLHGITDDETALILWPVGRPFATKADEVTIANTHSFEPQPHTPVCVEYEHFSFIIDTLALAHAQGMVHNDMTLTNIFDTTHIHQVSVN